MNFSVLFPCFIDHFFLVSDFCQLSCCNFLQFFPFFYHCCLCIWNFHCLRQTCFYLWISKGCFSISSHVVRWNHLRKISRWIKRKNLISKYVFLNSGLIPCIKRQSFVAVGRSTRTRNHFKLTGNARQSSILIWFNILEFPRTAHRIHLFLQLLQFRSALMVFGLITDLYRPFEARHRSGLLSIRPWAFWSCSAASSLPDGPLRFPQTPFQCPRSRKVTLEPGSAGGDNLALT